MGRFKDVAGFNSLHRGSRAHTCDQSEIIRGYKNIAKAILEDARFGTPVRQRLLMQLLRSGTA